MKRRDEFRGYSLLSAGVCELVYTFMLCFVVLNVAAAKKNKEPRLEGLGVELHDLSIWARRNSCAAEEEKPQYFALAIGFCVVAGAYGAGVISGGAFNPAVALSLDITSLNKGWKM